MNIDDMLNNAKYETPESNFDAKKSYEKYLVYMNNKQRNSKFALKKGLIYACIFIFTFFSIFSIMKYPFNASSIKLCEKEEIIYEYNNVKIKKVTLSKYNETSKRANYIQAHTVSKAQVVYEEAKLMLELNKYTGINGTIEYEILVEDGSYEVSYYSAKRISLFANYKDLKSNSPFFIYVIKKVNGEYYSIATLKVESKTFQEFNITLLGDYIINYSIDSKRISDVELLSIINKQKKQMENNIGE